MLRLMLLRHAKAVADQGNGDHARALSPRGSADAAALGKALGLEYLVPELVLVSSATRTSMSAAQLLAQWPQAVAVKVTDNLYNASDEAVLAQVRGVDAHVRTLMVVGHNPAIAELALKLTGYGDRYAAVRMSQRFPPCAMAVLDFDTDQWQEVAFGKGRLERFVIPGDAAGGA
ncbi:MAG: histidine phosphatase family protein [Hyphomicrobiales bacterium]|nr:histidine phosphatase family protein [Hyphomicrobiales bacterium]MDE2114333.1 histidine phosphatase family protein [Hyphomicrobiales bacterium]